jgi:hypothetical protein
MDFKERIDAFAELGSQLRLNVTEYREGKSTEWTALINSQQHKNAWFTSSNVLAAIDAIAGELTSDKLERWTNNYPDIRKVTRPMTVGVIMAGNIPLVGFHDFLCVLITGNKILVKTSSKDSDLIVNISEILFTINPRFREMISFTEGTLTGFDAVIATGSNNTSRYFEFYFRKYPNIIRKNRNSIAIIDGNETERELTDLGLDIFSYFGLGCRNISKMYIPEGYDLKNLLNKLECFSDVINNNKYANNYDFSKAVFLVNKESFLDTGYLLIKEEKSLSSPVAVLYFEYYKTHDELMHKVDLLKDKIQCIVSRKDTPFGMAQKPLLWEYADGVDTIEFLLKKK